jgi:competence protein ComEC|tara:strand:- start:679 stop:1386 length:708 start_codon:yes stop_codon:yes gene_type:complete
MANLLDMLTLWLNNFILWIVKQEGFFIEDININLYEVFLFYALLTFIYVLYLKANKKIIVGLFFVILILQYKAHVVRSLNEKLTAAWLVSEYKNTVLFHKKEAVLYVYSSDPIEENHQLVKDFKTKYIIKNIAFETLKNSYTIEENPVLFVDELWAENIEIKNEKTILVLSQNTKINLEAMLQKNKIYLIVTDASSYPSLKERWRKTCTKLKTPYYDTQKEGPYLFTSKTRNISF